MNDKSLLFKALVNVQTELQNPSKNKEGYGYKYATLDSIIEQTKPVLKKYGLVVIQLLTGDGVKVGIETMIAHESGESLKETLWLPATDMKGVNLVQSLGASITYGRRYALSAILGISADDDDDATNASVFCHFGKNKGKEWASMSMASLNWYFKAFMDNKERTEDDNKALTTVTKLCEDKMRELNKEVKGDNYDQN